MDEAHTIIWQENKNHTENSILTAIHSSDISMKTWLMRKAIVNRDKFLNLSNLCASFISQLYKLSQNYVALHYEIIKCLIKNRILSETN